jgi:hypothetical protein
MLRILEIINYLFLNWVIASVKKRSHKEEFYTVNLLTVTILLRNINIISAEFIKRSKLNNTLNESVCNKNILGIKRNACWNPLIWIQMEILHKEIKLYFKHPVIQLTEGLNVSNLTQ